MKRKLVLFFALAAMGLTCAAAVADPPEGTPEPARIIDQFVAATQSGDAALRGVSMEVDIDANVPKLKKEGRLHALRQISRLGKITYKVLGFKGDNSVKNEVIARYLEAEQQAQTGSKFSISPDHYKFKFKGVYRVSDGSRIYIFQVSPLHKQVGLFKGEIWLDAKTCLPIQERGRFVKNPTIFFKNVEFVRSYAIQNGEAIPQNMMSTIKTRGVGVITLNINYTNFTPDPSSGGQIQIMTTGQAGGVMASFLK